MARVKTGPRVNRFGTAPMKRLRYDNAVGTGNQLNSLPEDVRQNIMERLPLHDAVGTGILSKLWRYKWAKLPQIVLDREFFLTIMMQRPDNSDLLIRYSNTVTNVLLSHEGPLHKFVLYIHRGCETTSNMFQWLRFASRKSVREFTLIYNSTYLLDAIPFGNADPFKLPSILFFYFEGLTSLTLHLFRIASLPATFTGFPNLLSLELRDCTWDSEKIMESLIGSCPKLRLLKFIAIKLDFSDLETINLSIDAQNLESLVVDGSFTNICLGEKTTNIRILQLDILGATRANLVYSSLPVLQSLQLGPDYFACELLYNKHGLIETIGLIETRTLTLIGLPLYNQTVAYFALKLLKSSLFLESLICQITKHDDRLQWPTLTEVGCSSFENGTFPSLKYVELVNVSASTSQFDFIKMILECAPVLEVMNIKLNEKVNKPEHQLKIAVQLMQYYRASRNLQIIFKSG